MCITISLFRRSTTGKGEPPFEDEELEALSEGLNLKFCSEVTAKEWNGKLKVWREQVESISATIILSCVFEETELIFAVDTFKLVGGLRASRPRPSFEQIPILDDQKQFRSVYLRLHPASLHHPPPTTKTSIYFSLTPLLLELRRQVVGAGLFARRMPFEKIIRLGIERLCTDKVSYYCPDLPGSRKRGTIVESKKVIYAVFATVRVRWICCLPEWLVNAHNWSCRHLSRVTSQVQHPNATDNYLDRLTAIFSFESFHFYSRLLLSSSVVGRFARIVLSQQ
jgi:hypothetical protein